jgi:Zn-dependent peptidase ImmA (M78 family)/transcriptional regulator with XRE-family HTH domain
MGSQGHGLLLMTVNPEILKWARETAGLTVADAARKLGFTDNRQRTAAGRLTALETGQDEPSRSVLLRMSKEYRRSLLVFYLSAPPRTADRGQDFRTVSGGASPHYDALVDALIRDIRGRQNTLRALLEETEQQRVNFVGSATLDDDATALSRRITEQLQFLLAEFRQQATIEAAFTYLRQKIETAGVYVLLVGNLGSHHTNISAEVFRGFAIADRVAPFIVINDQDARPAWAFTALHELAHLWLGATGISGASIETRIEGFCNDVAGEILLPTAEIATITNLRRTLFDQVFEAISTHAAAWKLSRAMVAYRFLRGNVISEAMWRQVVNQLRQEWLDMRARREKDEESANGSGPRYYVVKRHRLGNALLDTIRRSLGDGAISYTKAAQVLGVKPRNVDPLINGASLLDGR